METFLAAMAQVLLRLIEMHGIDAPYLFFYRSPRGGSESILKP